MTRERKDSDSMQRLKKKRSGSLISEPCEIQHLVSIRCYGNRRHSPRFEHIPSIEPRTGLKSIFCYGRRYAGCDFVKLREKILNVSRWIHLRFFRSLSSARLASHRPRYEATFETSSNVSGRLGRVVIAGPLSFPLLTGWAHARKGLGWRIEIGRAHV